MGGQQSTRIYQGPVWTPLRVRNGTQKCRIHTLSGPTLRGLEGPDFVLCWNIMYSDRGREDGRRHALCQSRSRRHTR